MFISISQVSQHLIINIGRSHVRDYIYSRLNIGAITVDPSHTVDLGILEDSQAVTASDALLVRTGNAPAHHQDYSINNLHIKAFSNIVHLMIKSFNDAATTVRRN